MSLPRSVSVAELQEAPLPLTRPMLKGMGHVPDRFIAMRNMGPRVYFFYCRRLRRIKIGMSRNIAARMDGIQRESGLRLEFLGSLPGGLAKEKELHQRFAHHRRAREWFSACKEIFEFVREHGQGLA